MPHDLEDQVKALRTELEHLRQREDLLARIDAYSRTATDPAEITSRVAALLGRYLQVDRSVFCEIMDDEDTYIVTGSYQNGLEELPTHFKVSDYSPATHELLKLGKPYVVEDTETDTRTLGSLPTYRTTGVRAGISIPLMKDRRLRAALAVHTREPRVWTEEEITLVDTIALRCWETTERLRALRALEAEREELRRKSAELERQHAELKTIYDTAPIGLAYFDLDDYHYLRLNKRQAAFFGLQPEDVVGKTLIQMAPIEGLRELFDQVAGGEPVINFPLEGTLVTDPTDYRYWTVSYFPVYGADGTIQGITAASQEITNQKKAENALIQTEKLAAVGRLAASIAHEINNPLESVTNLLFLARSSEDIDEVRSLLLTADAELRRASAITAQTLRFHRQSTSPLEVDTTVLVNEILNIYQGRLHNSRAELATRFRARKSVRCFDGEIRQVLANLIGNALDAMSGKPGRLLLRTREGTQWSTGQRGLVITVADTGSGMSPQTIPRLFEPFFTTKGTTGTGLGLWVSKEIVARHRGGLRLRSSQSPRHHGTVFTIFLPFDAATR